MFLSVSCDELGCRGSCEILVDNLDSSATVSVLRIENGFLFRRDVLVNDGVAEYVVDGTLDVSHSRLAAAFFDDVSECGVGQKHVRSKS